MDAPQLAQLTTEIQTDPKALGYAALIAAGSDQGIADKLNAVGLSGETIQSHVLSAAQFAEAIVEAEWSALTVQQCLYQVLLAVTASFDPNNATVKAGVLALYGSATTTRANLAAALTIAASRAQVLFGQAATVAARDVAQALGRGG